MQPVWHEIEQTLVKLYSVPHNQPELRAKHAATGASEKELDEVRSGGRGRFSLPVKNPVRIKQYQNLELSE